MKLKQAIKIEEVLGRKLPVDMYSNMRYYSESREEWIDIMELDVIHAIRILRKYVRNDTENDEETPITAEQYTMQ